MTRSHRTITTATFVLAVGVGSIVGSLGLAACGATNGGSGGTHQSTPSSRSGPHVASAVTVVRSGGLTGGKTRWVFDADQPPPEGFSRADVADILERAGSPALRSMPAQPP